MKAAFIHETGPADNIVYGDLPTPTPRGAQVLVKVSAVAVNPVDTYVRAGMVKWDLPKPFIVGCDLAGVVEAVGPDARRFKKGDRVWCSNQGLLGRQGTFAEYVAVDEEWLHPTPANVDDKTAAAAALVGITAHLGLFLKARLQAGETIFVNGGGGVGSTVIQVAKAAGARVITATGSDAKMNYLRQLGADVTINYKTQDVAAEVKKAAPQGVNIFWETQRTPNFEFAVSLLARHGHMVLMAGRDAKPVFPVGPFYVNCLSLHGFVMFLFTAQEQRVCGQDLNRWLSEGKLKPRIDRVLPLSETAQAHRLQEQSTIGGTAELTGKIVLVP